MLKHSLEDIGFVFIHGAGLKSGVWSKVVEGFQHPCLLMEFPLREGAMETRRDLSLDDYVKHMKRQIDAWKTRKFVIVAHSLGGVLAQKLTSLFPDRLAGIVAVGAAIPKNGGSFLSIFPFPQKLVLSIILRISGTKPPESAIRKGLCSDLTPEQAAEIVHGFVPESVRVFTDRIHMTVPHVPKLYVKLTNDKELSPSLQKQMIANFSPQVVHSLDTGHLPMISDPGGLRSILEDFATKYAKD